MKKLSLIAVVALVSAISAVGLYKVFEVEKTTVILQGSSPAHYASISDAIDNRQPVDFTYAAALTTRAVVHIKNTSMSRVSQYYNHPLYEYFKPYFDQENNKQQRPSRISFGSGVIISEDGYIVTNNHVVEGGDELEVTLPNNKTYPAEVIGTDPSTDLALLKIDETGLPTIPFANSDEVKVGEWVLAVGNPFNFNTTVTAGIVSAKGRYLNILDRDKMPIESFIQTDAAVNRGNSGGALASIDGKLIGINTAIVSPSGTYAGYSFAVPSNIVAKVVSDLKKHGIVQRALLGIEIISMNAQLAEDRDIDVVEGVYVAKVNPGSGAADAGIIKHDVIISIDGRSVKNVASLQEQVARHSPGDRVAVTLLRNGKTKKILATLKNKNNTLAVLEKHSSVLIPALGAEFVNISEADKKELGVQNGVRIHKIHEGLVKQAKIKEGFVVTHMGQNRISSVEDLSNALNNKKGGIMLEGVYPNDNEVYYYDFGLDG